MARPLIECVPNFSEGRSAATLAAIGVAIRSVAGVSLLGEEGDPDHHRSVFTFAGRPEAVCEAAFRAVGVAKERIDLREHRGVHPRIGAADVVPLVPLQGITMEECATLAHGLGERIASGLDVPVYFYEAAARRPERRRLELIRKGGFEELRELAVRDASRAPDVGGPQLHPSAGATVVGARKFLLAFNINLDTPDVAIAQQVARKVRASSGGLAHVKAMGVYLASRGLAQVSMNLTDFEVTPLQVVYDAVRDEAARLGASIVGSEFIGLIPAKALAQVAAAYLRSETNPIASILESRLLTDLLD
jgi:glutamate formiminotransferase